MSKRIPADRVINVQNPALIASGSGDGNHPITVIPLVDGDTIAGLEIRCSCGSRVVIDCIYNEAPAAEAHT